MSRKASYLIGLKSSSAMRPELSSFSTRISKLGRGLLRRFRIQRYADGVRVPIQDQLRHVKIRR